MKKIHDELSSWIKKEKIFSFSDIVQFIEALNGVVSLNEGIELEESKKPRVTFNVLQ